MAKKLASSYNAPPSKEIAPISREEHLACKAHGCPLPGTMFSESGQGLCAYHHRKSKFFWPQITEMLKKNSRLFRLIRITEAITNAEFDQVQRDKSWALEEMICPVPGECHKHWVLRVKETIHRALKQQVAEIVKSEQIPFEHMDSKTMSSSWAVSELTSGALLKNKNKSKEQQLKELKEKQENAA